jgi:hypothetical protein
LGGRKEVRQKAVVEGRLEKLGQIKDLLRQAAMVQPVFCALLGNSSGELARPFNPRTGLGVHDKIASGKKWLMARWLSRDGIVVDMQSMSPIHLYETFFVVLD